MGHDHHFLSRLDRVARTDSELALSLYRDHVLVREIISRSSAPPTAERIAIALRDPVEGPFVLVAQDGHFVTCLAQGMKTDLPVVSREELDFITKDMDAVRGAAKVIETSAEHSDVALRLFAEGQHLFREDIPALRAVQPALVHEVVSEYLVLAEGIDNVISRLRRQAGRNSRRALRVLGSAYRLMWTMRDLAIVAGIDSPRLTLNLSRVPWGSLTQIGIISEQSFVALPVMWWPAQVGPALVPKYSKRLLAWTRWDTVLDAIAGLVAIASRHPTCRAEVIGLLSAVSQEGGDVRLGVAQAGAAVLEAVDSGQNTEVVHKAARAQIFELRDMYRLDVARPEDIPGDEAVGYQLVSTFNILEAPEAFVDFLLRLSVVACLEAEQLFLPRAMADLHPTRFREEVQGRVLANLRDPLPTLSARKEERAVGRNAPCPCGSGRKYKKCCGCGDAPSATEARAATAANALVLGDAAAGAESSRDLTRGARVALPDAFSALQEVPWVSTDE
jgi:hypothetical protein